MEVKMIKKSRITFILLVFFLGLSTSLVNAQGESSWTINLRRNWGYGAGSNIQGSMTLSLSGDLVSITRVEFFIDDQLLSDQNEAPFSFSFNTDNYEEGVHELHARVYTKNGEVISVGPSIYNFLSSADAMNTTFQLIGVILGITLLGMAISYFVSSRNRSSGERAVGPLGLAVCKRCGQAFPRSIFGFNLVAGKFERCPHCGKWQLTRRASAAEIEQAERKLRPEEPPAVEKTPEKNSLDESRFIDM